MKVKILIPISGPNVLHKAGDMPDLPAKNAKALIKAGYAEKVDEIPPPKETEGTHVLEEGEKVLTVEQNDKLADLLDEESKPESGQAE